MELREIKGLGEKRIKALNDMGIFSSKDLALYFPKTYFDLEHPDTFKPDGKYKLIKCRVLEPVNVARIRKNFNYSFCLCQDEADQRFVAIWYNQPYIKSAVNENDTLYLYGKNSNTKHGYFVVSTYRNQKKIKDGTNLLAVYRSSKTIGQSLLISAIDEVKNKEVFDSIFPKEFEEKNLSETLNQAINDLHNPINLESLQAAKDRLDYEKILPIMELNQELKNKKQAAKQQKYSGFSQIYSKFCSFLNFELTPSQKKVISDIEEDLKKSISLNRLVQGDVGSGKTVIAFLFAAYMLFNNYSAIMMAPTSVLAFQHYEKAKPLFEKLGLKTFFLSSQTKQGERAAIIRALENKEPIFLIGTHSCLNESLPLDRVTMLIIDEQQRFGVKQRASIINRASSMELLMLTATPIPRSMAITYYGGLDVSVLEKPPFAKDIQTNIISVGKEGDMWSFIEEKINSGSKVYVVCANIDETDDDYLQPCSAEAMYKWLAGRFGKERVLLAHGRLNSEQENNILNKFKDGQQSILVSTTIVEVGVDVSAADIMVIVSPEKFGLSTLHQLRGRIGRAGQKSYCFCLSRGLNDTSADRIKFFKDHDSGFEISEYDYNSRGAGNILGTKQHGKIENIFDFVSLETLKKAENLYGKLRSDYSDTSFLLDSSTLVKAKDIAMN